MAIPHFAGACRRCACRPSQAMLRAARRRVGRAVRTARDELPRTDGTGGGRSSRARSRSAQPHPHLPIRADPASHRKLVFCEQSPPSGAAFTDEWPLGPEGGRPCSSSRTPGDGYARRTDRSRRRADDERSGAGARAGRHGIGWLPSLTILTNDATDASRTGRRPSTPPYARVSSCSRRAR